MYWYYWCFPLGNLIFWVTTETQSLKPLNQWTVPVFWEILHSLKIRTNYIFKNKLRNTQVSSEQIQESCSFLIIWNIAAVALNHLDYYVQSGTERDAAATRGFGLKNTTKIPEFSSSARRTPLLVVSACPLPALYPYGDNLKENISDHLPLAGQHHMLQWNNYTVGLFSAKRYDFFPQFNFLYPLFCRTLSTYSESDISLETLFKSLHIETS